MNHKIKASIRVDLTESRHKKVDKVGKFLKINGKRNKSGDIIDFLFNMAIKEIEEKET
jgi:hypothetical protein